MRIYKLFFAFLLVGFFGVVFAHPAQNHGTYPLGDVDHSQKPTTEHFDEVKAATPSVRPKIYGVPQIEAVKLWGLSGDSTTSGAKNPNANDPFKVGAGNFENEITGLRGVQGLGESFTILQGKYFAWIFFLLVLLTPLAFFGHFKVIGPIRFNHHGPKLKVFSKYNVVIHWLTAVPCVVLCLTGLAMVFGEFLGGGALIRFCRDLHAIATPFFAIFMPLMFLMWLKDSLPKAYDIKWMMIMGGYLSKRRFPIPAGKFNAGQKMWFWTATLGGAVMLISGAVMFFHAFDINTLRFMAIIHNFVGMALIALLITHIYMAVFAIEGAFDSIVDGNIGEEEIEILHSYYYEQLKKSGTLESLRVK